MPRSRPPNQLFQLVDLLFNQAAAGEIPLLNAFFPHCDFCGVVVYVPKRCSVCGRMFCIDHGYISFSRDALCADCADFLHTKLCPPCRRKLHGPKRSGQKNTSAALPRQQGMPFNPLELFNFTCAVCQTPTFPFECSICGQHTCAQHTLISPTDHVCVRCKAFLIDSLCARCRDKLIAGIAQSKTSPPRRP